MADGRRISPIFGVLAVAIGLTVAGCGSSGSDSAPVSKAEFVKQANATCEKLQRRVESGLRDYEKGLNGVRPQGAALAAVRTKVAETILIPIKRQEAEELGELGAPSGDESQVNAIVDALEEGVEASEKNPEQAVVKSGETFGKSGELAAEYGLSSC